jgi:hypothetical protein
LAELLSVSLLVATTTRLSQPPLPLPLNLVLLVQPVLLGPPVPPVQLAMLVYLALPVRLAQLAMPALLALRQKHPSLNRLLAIWFSRHTYYEALAS